MSQSPIAPSEEEEHEEAERPISALPPQADSQTDIPPSMGSSPALQCLDELFSAGKLCGAKVAELKASFTLLQETLKCSQESEVRLLQEARRCTAVQQEQHRVLEGAESLPETPDTEAGRMRQQLLRIHNDLLMAEEHQYQLDFKLECSQNEKTALLMESQSQAKPAEQEKKVKALKQDVEELRKEVAQRHLEIRSLKEDLEGRHEQLEHEMREVHDKEEVIKEEEAKLAQVLSMPVQLGKEIERMNRKKADAEKKKAEVGERLSETEALLKESEAQARALEEGWRVEAREQDVQRSQREALERQHVQLQREQEMASAKVAVIMAQRGVLDVNIGHLEAEKRGLQDTLGRHLREKDRELHGLKKLELQLKVVGDDLAQAEALLTKTKAQRDAVPKGDAALQQRQELERDVKALKEDLLRQRSLTEAEAQATQLCLEQEQELIREAHRQRQNLRHLSCLTQIKADERQQKARELSRAEQRYSCIKQELKGKQLVIQEHRRQEKEVQTRLAVFAKMYDNEKKERQKCDQLIQKAEQKLVEMQENSSFLENQRRILHTVVCNKEKLLQESRVRHRQSLVVHDRLRNDKSEVARALVEMHEVHEEQKLSVSSLTHTIDLLERTLLDMQQKYESTVQSRRDCSMLVEERREELYNLQEKGNLQDRLLQDGNVKVQALDEEIHVLNLNIGEKKRQISVLHKQLSKKRVLEGEHTTLQIQLLECRERQLDLEKALQARTEGTHIRELDGQDPTRVELLQKIEQLEVRLAGKEQQLLEKELACEQVIRLSQQIQARVENGRQDTLEVAKKVNEVESRIRDTTRKMMAVASELSMYQARAISLQQEMKDRQLQLDSCQQRLEQGLPPSPDMELEWQCIQREESRRRTELQERARLAEEEEERSLPGGGHTTAQRRPNAYIPQGDELPLPRPYGALAPFVPSKAGSSMRHIRKPEPKPIEI